MSVHNSLEKGKIAFRYKEYIYNKWHLEWKDNICNLERNPILRKYSQYKSELYLERYLFNIKEYKLRKVINKFRMSSHMLEIERGRYKRPRVAPENRLGQEKNFGSGPLIFENWSGGLVGLFSFFLKHNINIPNLIVQKVLKLEIQIKPVGLLKTFM